MRQLILMAHYRCSGSSRNDDVWWRFTCRAVSQHVHETQLCLHASRSIYGRLESFLALWLIKKVREVTAYEFMADDEA